LGIPVEMVQFLLKLVLKQRILAVYHNFHWVQVPRKLLTANFIHLMLRNQSRESQIFWKGRSWELKILERSESDILPPTLQPWV